MRLLIFVLLMGFYLIVGENVDGSFIWERIPIAASESAEGLARTAFEYFFRYGSYGVPDNVEVLGVSLTDGLLVLDVCEAILDYNGSAFEVALLAQLVKVASAIPFVERLTLKINGIPQTLAKGTEVYAMLIP